MLLVVSAILVAIILGFLGIIYVVYDLSESLEEWAGSFTSTVNSMDKTFDEMDENFDEMDENFDEMNEYLSNWDESLENLENSVQSIKDSVTSVDLQDMEQILSALADRFQVDFAGNSIRTSLKESGLDVIISLTGRDEETEIIIKIEEEVEETIDIRGLKSVFRLIGEDTEIQEKEQELFGQEVEIRVISPRRVICNLPTSDFEIVTEWIPAILDKIDDYYSDIYGAKTEFDRELGEKLEEMDFEVQG